MKSGTKLSGMHGPLRSPMVPVPIKGTLTPRISGGTTIAGTAPKAAPIQSPLAVQNTVRSRKG